MYVCMYVCVCVGIYVCVCVGMYVCMYVCVYVCWSICSLNYFYRCTKTNGCGLTSYKAVWSLIYSETVRFSDHSRQRICDIKEEEQKSE